MIKNLDKLTAQLQKLSQTINTFKSEAVQLKLVELIFNEINISDLEGSIKSISTIDKIKKIKAAKVKPVAKVKKLKKALPIVEANAEAKTKVSKPAKVKAIAKKKPVKKGKTKSKPGRTTAIRSLIESGYFASKRSAGEIVKYCNEELKVPCKISDLSGIIDRLVKDNVLQKEKNKKSKKFEFSIKTV
jgi:superfamily II DNA helicase RecQ